MMANGRAEAEFCLKKMCFRAVRRHFAALSTEAFLDLPVTLVKELLPHLTVCQLDELQPALNRKGISTLSGWLGLLQDICGPKTASDSLTEEEAKQEVMRQLFIFVFYGFTNSFVSKNIANLQTLSFLRAAAKCITHFLITASSPDPLPSLTGERRLILELLEKRIRSVSLTNTVDLSKRKSLSALCVLHRLIDHGVATELVVSVPCAVTLARLLRGRGSQYTHDKSTYCAGTALSSEEEDNGAVPRKRRRPDPANAGAEKPLDGENFALHLRTLCRVTPGSDCPQGQIERLEVRRCSPECLVMLGRFLPTFFCLRSLTLHSEGMFSGDEVRGLARSLRLLSLSGRGSLAHLSAGVLPRLRLAIQLADAFPTLTSLSVEVEAERCAHPPAAEPNQPAPLQLEHLRVRLGYTPTADTSLTSVLGRCPRLTSLHLAGMRLPTGCSQSSLLNTLSESHDLLKRLVLEDVKLSDCLPELLNLLRGCRLEELRLNDCRLLERRTDRRESLQQLVVALKAAPSLRTLGLAQNRLARDVCVLAELFSGPSPSSVTTLDISSNFIQAADLLGFSEALRTRRPPRPLTLDLRRNPGDRDPETWNLALSGLRPLCVLLEAGWRSTNMMADHIGNM